MNSGGRILEFRFGLMFNGFYIREGVIWEGVWEGGMRKRGYFMRTSNMFF